jgi:hypothetical protein
MPLVSRHGPDWVRPVLARSEERLGGLNPVLRFFASLFRRPARQGAGSISRRSDGPEDGPAGAGVGARLIPPAPTLSGAAAKHLGAE